MDIVICIYKNQNNKTTIFHLEHEDANVRIAHLAKIPLQTILKNNHPNAYACLYFKLGSFQRNSIPLTTQKTSQRRGGEAFSAKL